AYDVMSYGMRNGSFSPGHPELSTYINASKCDYLGARRIINSNDVAALIAGWARDLEMLLRVSCDSSFSDSPTRGFVGKIPMVWGRIFLPNFEWERSAVAQSVTKVAGL